VHHNLAVTYFMLEQTDKGIIHCRKALKLRPDYALALYNLALAHYRKGAVSRARRYARRALTLEPDNRQIRDLSQRVNDTAGRILQRIRREA
jgi:tetratricopeptide (TPR) repeat protein